MKALQIKNILIPTDFSKTGSLAVDQAVYMARLFNANLYLLHVVELTERLFGIYGSGLKTPYVSQVVKLAKEKLNRTALSLQKKHGIPVKAICIKGSKVWNEVLKAVKDKNIDIVIMGTHGASGFNEYFVGSNAHKTVSVCPCPVISVRARPKKTGFTNIVLPIGDHFNSRQKVTTAIALAKKYEAKIHLLGLLDKKGDVDPKKFDVKLGSVEKLLKEAELTYVKKTVKADNLSAAAIRYSGKVKADLLVVLADEESHLSGALFGVFTKQIVNHSRIPVMSIRPSRLGVYNFDTLPGFS